MAEASVMSSSQLTLTETVQDPTTTSPRMVLKLRKPKNSKEVRWEQGTVDNEHLNKKKSKCCCIYTKPKLFGESSDEEDDCTGDCHGHKNKCYKKMPEDDLGPPDMQPQS